MQTPIVVVGAGVIGLTIALRLQKTGKYNVTVVAENIPGPLPKGAKQSTKWASPWAGAHWRAWAGPDDIQLQHMEIETYKEMQILAKNTTEPGVSEAEGVDLFEKDPGSLWYKDRVEDACKLPESDLPIGVEYGLKYKSLLINVPQYLLYLKQQVVDSGCCIVQKHIKHINEAVAFSASSKQHPPVLPLVINCTGLGSYTLGGVEDKTMYPIRGQVLVVHAPDVKHTITRIGSLFSYVIPRGDGTVVIGGTAERGSWDSTPNASTTHMILQKVLSLEPALLPAELLTMSDSERIQELKKRIVSINVGFRPARKNGVRLETEYYVSSSGKPFRVLHCYGHAGFGYQSSFGFASLILQMVAQSKL